MWTHLIISPNKSDSGMRFLVPITNEVKNDLISGSKLWSPPGVAGAAINFEIAHYQHCQHKPLFKVIKFL